MGVAWGGLVITLILGGGREGWLGQYVQISATLLLNPAKMEAVFYGTRQRLSQHNTSQGIDVAGTTNIQFTDAVKLLRVTLDSTLSFDKHVAEVARQFHYHIRALKHIRPLLTLEAADFCRVNCRQETRLLQRCTVRHFSE